MMDSGFRGGMMMPGGGLPIMMGRGGFHPPTAPMDYLYDPYMDGGLGYYGGRPSFHPGRGHPCKYIASMLTCSSYCEIIFQFQWAFLHILVAIMKMIMIRN